MMNDDIRHVRIFFTDGYGPMLSAPMHLDKMLAASAGNPEHIFRLVELKEWDELCMKLIELEAKKTPTVDEVKLAKMQHVIDLAIEVVEAYVMGDERLGRYVTKLDAAIEDAR